MKLKHLNKGWLSEARHIGHPVDDLIREMIQRLVKTHSIQDAELTKQQFEKAIEILTAQYGKPDYSSKQDLFKSYLWEKPNQHPDAKSPMYIELVKLWNKHHVGQGTAWIYSVHVS